MTTTIKGLLSSALSSIYDTIMAGADAIRVQTETARDQTLTAATLEAFDYTYLSKAAFDAATVTWEEDNVVLVLSDESQRGSATFYLYTGGAFSEPVMLPGAGWEALQGVTYQVGNGRGLPRTMNALFRALNGDDVRLKVVPQLDSINGNPWWTIWPLLAARLRIASPPGEPTLTSTGTPPTSNTYLDENTPISGTRTLVTDYAVWFKGGLQEHTDGEFRCYRGGAKIAANLIRMFYVVRADAGTFQMQVDGVLVGDVVDASDGTPGELKVFEYEPAVALTTSNEVRFVVTGTVQFAERHAVDYAQKIEIYSQLSQGGLDFEDAFGTQQSRDNYQFLLETIDPDWITLSARESERPLGADDGENGTVTSASAYVSTYGPMVAEIWQQLNCDVTIFTGTPMTSESSNLSVLRGMKVWARLIADARAQGYAWDMVDEFTPWMPDGKEATARAYATKLRADLGANIGDSNMIHLGRVGVHAFAGPVKAFFDRAFGSFGGSPQSPWSRMPARMGFGTTFMPTSGTTTNGLAIDGSGNGWDITASFYRMLGFYATGGDLIARFTNGTSSEANVLPISGTRWDGDTNQYFGVSVSGGFRTLALRDDDTASGRTSIDVDTLALAQYSLAARGSAWLAANVGRIAYDSDGAIKIVTSTGGTPLGVRVPVPGSLTSLGRPGNWAYDATSGYFYVYTGDGTTHSWKVVNRRYLSGLYNITAGSQVQVAHGLGAVPSSIQISLECQTAEAGFAVGDRIAIPPDALGVLRFDDTNLTFRIAAAPGYATLRPDTGAAASLTMTNWQIRLRAM